MVTDQIRFDDGASYERYMGKWSQLAYARTRPASRITQFHQGDAMALPFPSDTFDVAVMALVIFFVPDPAKGVAEMARVVCPGGTVTA